MKRAVALLLQLVNLLPSAQTKSYKEGEKVPLYVNKAGPYDNPKETYSYYQLPVCRPEQVVYINMPLSKTLDGDRYAESLYRILFRVDVPKVELCKTAFTRGSEREALARSIEKKYYFEFVADGLILRNYIGYLDEQHFPHTHKLFLFTHHHFTFEFNGDEIVSARISVERERPLRIDDLVENDQPIDITYTYSVEWQPSVLKRSNKQSSVDDNFFPKSLEIHWLSVINSSLLVFMLLAFVMLILIRVVRSDLSKYNFSKASEKAALDDYDDHGWKVVHADVFRFPRNVNLLCAMLGVGCQLLLITGTIMVIVLFKIIDEYGHGLINATALILYAFTSGIAGYISAGMYKRFSGKRWIANINLTYGLFSVPTFMVWCFENSVSWAYRSTQALPFQTVLLLLGVWALIGYPLTVLGGLLGKNFSDNKFDIPCRTRQIPRQLPENLPYYQSAFVYSILGGFLSFSAISVETYYIFATIWGHESYTLFGVLLIVFIILLSVTASGSVALTYFQLSAEDYNWWWRSVFVGGSTGFFVLAYAVFFYVARSQMSGFFQTAQFFGYVLLVCYGFFLSLGTVAFFASWKFVCYIYGNIKTD